MAYRESKSTPRGGMYKLNYLPFTSGGPTHRQIKCSCAAHLGSVAYQGTGSAMQLLLIHLHFCLYRFPADL